MCWRESSLSLSQPITSSIEKKVGLWIVNVAFFGETHLPDVDSDVNQATNIRFSTRSHQQTKSSATTKQRRTMGKANDHGVLKNDPADCDRPACDDMMSKLKKAAQAAAVATAPAAPQEATITTPKVDNFSGRPLGSADLGRSTWGLLHSMVRDSCLCT
jgi:hypothetical protein